MGVRLAKRNSKQDGHEVIKAASAVISNASVWDTQKLLPGGAAPQKWRQESLATPMTGSFMHLHLGVTSPLVHPSSAFTPKTERQDPLSMRISGSPMHLHLGVAPLMNIEAVLLDAPVHASHPCTRSPSPGFVYLHWALIFGCEWLACVQGSSTCAGIDASGLPEDLDIHHLVVNDWEDLEAPQNVCIASIPTVFNPSLAPPGKATVHAYTAGNEPYSLWEGLDRRSQEYKDLKVRVGFTHHFFNIGGLALKWPGAHCCAGSPSHNRLCCEPQGACKSRSLSVQTLGKL